MLRVLLTVAALIGGAICFLGGSAADLSRLSFYGISGDHMVGGGLFLFGMILFVRSSSNS